MDEVVVAGELPEEARVGPDGPVRAYRLHRLVRSHSL